MVLADMQIKGWAFKSSALLFFVCLFSVFTSPVLGRMMAVDTARPVFPELSKAAVLPSLEQCTHKTGRLWLTVSNWGFLGKQRNVFFRDCLTGGFSSSARG